MSNMSYCRFQNTLQDLQDCMDNMGEQLSPAEHRARHQIIQLAYQIADEYTDGGEELPHEDEQ